jgi:AraC family transcriptional regulator
VGCSQPRLKDCEHAGGRTPRAAAPPRPGGEPSGAEAVAPRERSVLAESDAVRVYDVCCRASRSRFAADEQTGTAEVIVVRRGVFVVRQRGGEMVAEPVAPLVLGEGEYEVCHPGAEGDDCTMLIVQPSLLLDAVGGVGGRAGTRRPDDLLAIALARRALSDAGDTFEQQELGLLLLAAVARAFTPVSRPQLGRPQLARVDQVRTLLGSDPAKRWDLTGVARTVHWSPFHLARQFRAVNGETISDYLRRLRLGLALNRLADGEQDLSALALDLGFAHHSHFGSCFKRALGLTPSAARQMLSRGSIDQLRALLADPGETARS